MKEKKHVEQTPTTGGGSGSVFDGAPGLPPNLNVTVSSGPYAEELPVGGKTIGEVRKHFSDRMDIDSKAQAIVNGKPQGEDYTLQSGEALMFVHHAGEKGSMTVHIEGEVARVGTGGGHIPLGDLISRVGPSISTGPVILLFGIKTILSQGNTTLWFWEQPPRVHKFRWIRSDSPAPYGGGATYRDVTIALPYVIIMAVFQRQGDGMPALTLRDECFFRTAPLKSLDDELSFPGLLNCSKYNDGNGGMDVSHPLSWICTQYLKRNKKMQSNDMGDRFQASFEAVRYCLLETGFNLSSEHHEGNSWYGASKKIDKRIETIEAWEKYTEQDPLFVLDVPWIKTKHSVRQLSDRVFKQHGSPNGAVKTADDLARIIINR